MADRSGLVQTVLGTVAAAQLGYTLPHEHLLWDPVGNAAGRVSPATERGKWDQDVRLDNYYDVRRNYGSYKRPQQLLDANDAAEEVSRYRDAGGDCIVDATPADAGRDPEGLYAVSRASGVHVVMGSGYYVENYHPDEVRVADEQAIAEWIARDIDEGAGPRKIRAGIIGEIGLSWPVVPGEHKVLKGAVIAAQRTGAILMVHPGRDRRAPLDAVARVREAGGDPARLIISHMERTLFSVEEFAKLAETGCYLGFDLFGLESSYYPWSPVDLPNDAMRIDYIIALCDRGFSGQVLMSHDIDMKVRLEKYGGEGYGHILRRVLPLMRRKGMGDADIESLLIKNPAEALAFV